jgi:hypothetical protein
MVYKMQKPKISGIDIFWSEIPDTKTANKGHLEPL